MSTVIRWLVVFSATLPRRPRSGDFSKDWSTRERVSALVRGAGDEAGQRVVPACPRWTVRDVVAHLTGVCDDILAGRLDGVATDPWTDAQVARRAGRPVEDILDDRRRYVEQNGEDPTGWG